MATDCCPLAFVRYKRYVHPVGKVTERDSRNFFGKVGLRIISLFRSKPTKEELDDESVIVNEDMFRQEIDRLRARNLESRHIDRALKCGCACHIEGVCLLH
jgi:hypothetical protein